MLRRLSVFPVPEQEQRLWELDQRINARGLACDLQMVEGALAVDEQVTRELRQEAIAKIEGGPGTPTSRARDAARHKRALHELEERRDEILRAIDALERALSEHSTARRGT